MMKIGIDLGGTKTEIIALSPDGVEVHRHRAPTDRSSYGALLQQIAGLVRETETKTGTSGTVGIGIPGTISAETGLVKNANTTLLNGKPFAYDLSERLDRDIRCLNDANCLALSEAIDGAGANHALVFAVILGTGCGAGIAWNGRPWTGPNQVAGEWGHNPLPWPAPDELPGLPCWCGKTNCIERWISGTGFEEDYARSIPEGAPVLDAKAIVGLARNADPAAAAALERYFDRLTRCLAHVIHVLDPSVIVLGGGMSNIDELYTEVPARLPSVVFGGEARTPILRNRHGDSSGVRGAAWLWDF